MRCPPQIIEPLNLTKNDNGKACASHRLSQGRRRSSTCVELDASLKSTDLRQRISSSNAFRSNYDLSPDIEELLNSALAQKYADPKYQKAARTIQSYYRRHKMCQRFEFVKRGLSDVSLNPMSLSVARAFGDSKNNFMDFRLDEAELHEFMPIGLPQVASDTDIQDLTIEADAKEPLRRQQSSLVTTPVRESSVLGDDRDKEARSDLFEELRRRSQSAIPATYPWPKDEDAARNLRTGVYMFNRKPRRGVEYLLAKGVLQNHPRSIALFLLYPESLRLSKTSIGEFLGEYDLFNMEVLYEFVDLLGFAGMPFDAALRYYLSFFRLPGEAQKIDRMMEAFAKRYYAQNYGNPHIDMPFDSPDTAYILAYSCIMLNTDAHNPSVKRKMTKDGFIRNNRGINHGRDLPQDFLRELYDKILSLEFVTQDSYIEEMRAVERTITGLTYELSVPYRHFVAEFDCEAVVDFVQKSSPARHPRKLLLFNDMLLAVKPRSKHDNDLKALIPLYGLTIIIARNSERYGKAFEILSQQYVRLGAFTCESEEQLDIFVATIQRYIDLVSCMEEDRIEQIETVILKKGASTRTTKKIRPRAQRLASARNPVSEDSDTFEPDGRKQFKKLSQKMSTMSATSAIMSDRNTDYDSDTGSNDSLSTAAKATRADSEPHLAGPKQPMRQRSLKEKMATLGRRRSNKSSSEAARAAPQSTLLAGLLDSPSTAKRNMSGTSDMQRSLEQGIDRFEDGGQ